MADKTKEPETPKEEAKEEGKEKDEMIPKADLEKLRSDFDDYKETSEGRLESLQDSLDSALEEQALKGKAPEAEEDDDEGGDEEEKKETSKLKKMADEKEPEAKEKETGVPAGESVEKDIEAAIREDEAFRDEILMREETRDLKDELKDAIAMFPNADENEILLAIEDGELEGRPDQIEALARSSQEGALAHREAILKEGKDSATEDLKQSQEKEKEGDISVPQSEGTPQAPKTLKDAEPGAPTNPNVSPGLYDEDNEWAKARDQAKAEGEGA